MLRTKVYCVLHLHIAALCTPKRQSTTLFRHPYCHKYPSWTARALTQRKWQCERCFSLEQRPSRPHRSLRLIMTYYSRVRRLLELCNIACYLRDSWHGLPATPPCSIECPAALAGMQDDQTSNRKPLQEQHAQVILMPDKPPSLDKATQPQRLSYWQRLSQNLNFVGVALFLRVLFVSDPYDSVHCLPLGSCSLSNGGMLYLWTCCDNESFAMCRPTIAWRCRMSAFPPLHGLTGKPYGGQALRAASSTRCIHIVLQLPCWESSQAFQQR